METGPADKMKLNPTPAQDEQWTVFIACVVAGLVAAACFTCHQRFPALNLLLPRPVPVRPVHSNATILDYTQPVTKTP